MSVLYAAAILLSLAGVMVLDHRHRLFAFAAPGRAVAVLVVGVAFFLLWDLVGIAAGVFLRGSSFMTGVLLAPELPVEELLFLTFLCYLTMTVHLGAARLLDRRRR